MAPKIPKRALALSVIGVMVVGGIAAGVLTRRGPTAETTGCELATATTEASDDGYKDYEFTARGDAVPSGTVSLTVNTPTAAYRKPSGDVGGPGDLEIPLDYSSWSVAMPSELSSAATSASPTSTGLGGESVGWTGITPGDTVSATFTVKRLLSLKEGDYLASDGSSKVIVTYTDPTDYAIDIKANGSDSPIAYDAYSGSSLNVTASDTGLSCTGSLALDSAPTGASLTMADQGLSTSDGWGRYAKGTLSGTWAVGALTVTGSLARSSTSGTATEEYLVYDLKSFTDDPVISSAASALSIGIDGYDQLTTVAARVMAKDYFDGQTWQLQLAGKNEGDTDYTAIDGAQFSLDGSTDWQTATASTPAELALQIEKWTDERAAQTIYAKFSGTSSYTDHALKLAIKGTKATATVPVTLLSITISDPEFYVVPATLPSNTSSTKTSSLPWMSAFHSLVRRTAPVAQAADTPLDRVLGQGFQNMTVVVNGSVTTGDRPTSVLGLPDAGVKLGVVLTVFGEKQQGYDPTAATNSLMAGMENLRQTGWALERTNSTTVTATTLFDPAKDKYSLTVPFLPPGVTVSASANVSSSGEELVKSNSSSIKRAFVGALKLAGANGSGSCSIPSNPTALPKQCSVVWTNDSQQSVDVTTSVVGAIYLAFPSAYADVTKMAQPASLFKPTAIAPCSTQTTDVCNALKWDLGNTINKYTFTGTKFAPGQSIVLPVYVKVTSPLPAGQTQVPVSLHEGVKDPPTSVLLQVESVSANLSVTK